jgi:Kef-type K+ transport system membrane component KefB
MVSVVLLPLFFALNGIRTRIDLLNARGVWIWTAIVIFAGFAGKLGGAILAARFTDHSWRDALTLGALLNTRGLVELVALNIAYDVGAFTPTLFTMLVMMAVVCTVMTGPLLDLINFESNRLAQVAVPAW